MSIYGQCSCGNLKIKWNCIDYSMSPRACQCEYCLSHNAAYVSKPGSVFELSVKDETQHKIVTQGSNTAFFHECSYCQSVVAVTAEIDGELYGIINANILSNKFEFAASVKTNFDGQTKQDKQKRWQQNWGYAKIF